MKYIYIHEGNPIRPLGHRGIFGLPLCIFHARGNWKH